MFAVLVTVLVLVGLALMERLAYRGDVLPGVAVPGVSASSHSEAQVRARLQALAKRMESEPIEARAGDTVLQVDPKSVDFALDVDATLAAARQAGRSGNPVEVVQGMILRRFRNDEVPLVVHTNRTKVAQVLDTWAAATAQGLENGGLRFDGARVVEVPPRSGVGLQRARAARLLDRELSSPHRSIITLPVGPTAPAVGAAEVRRAAHEARGILSAPTVVTAETATITITPEQLGAVMGATAQGRRLELTIDSARLRTELAPQLATIETEPKDATWNISGSTATVVPSVPSKHVNLDQVSKAILGGSHAVTAEVVTKEPKHNTAWAQKMNITTVVSSFTTTFTPGQARTTNIRTGAAALNGALVEPGQTFSLNERLGQRTIAKGYVPAPAIAGDLSYYDDVGGGVSQISTTLWNATFFGGYKDVTHSGHSLYISHYPMGREATLNYPSIDNKFMNDSPNAILIVAYAGPRSLTVSYYSTSDGRRVRAEGPNILQTIEPTVEYTTDPAKVQSAYKGYVVEVFRIISRPGLPDERQRFVTKYDMRPQVVLQTNPAPAPPAPAPGPAP